MGRDTRSAGALAISGVVRGGNAARHSRITAGRPTRVVDSWMDYFARNRTNLKRRWVLQVLLHRTLLGRANDRRAILLRKIGRQLDVEPHYPDHARIRLGLHMLDQTQAVGCDAAPLTEAQHIDAGAGA